MAGPRLFWKAVMVDGIRYIKQFAHGGLARAQQDLLVARFTAKLAAAHRVWYGGPTPPDQDAVRAVLERAAAGAGR